MSELKAHKIGDLCFDFKMGKDVGIDFYLKSEADKVIAELETKLAVAQQTLRLNKPEALFSDLEIMGRLNHQIDVVARRGRHQKHKRCLAMAKMCDCEENRLEAISPIFDTDKEYWEYNSDYWARWHDCWLALAEEPTWEKFLQLIHKEAK